MPPKKGKTQRLPQQIVAFENRDKGFHESLSQMDDDIANFAHPTRQMLCGQPNSGKSTLCMNIILHANPPFDRVVVWHADRDTREWDLVTDEIVDKAPAIEDFTSDSKNCLVIDDIALKGLPKDEKTRLDRLMGYASTHRGITCLVTTQQPNAIPANIRRMCSVFYLWNSSDAQSLRDIAMKAGVKSHELTGLLKLLPGPKDSLCVDLTGSPYKYRRNLFEIIDVD